MPRLQESVSISAPVERVWNVVADFEARPKWAPRVREVEILGGGPIREGSDIRIQVGRRSFIPRVVEMQPNKRLTLRVSGAAFRANHIYEVSAGVNDATLSLTAEYGGLLGAIVGRLLRKSLRRDLSDELAALKRAAESDVS